METIIVFIIAVAIILGIVIYQFSTFDADEPKLWIELPKGKFYLTRRTISAFKNDTWATSYNKRFTALLTYLVSMDEYSRLSDNGTGNYLVVPGKYYNTSGEVTVEKIIKLSDEKNG